MRSLSVQCRSSVKNEHKVSPLEHLQALTGLTALQHVAEGYTLRKMNHLVNLTALASLRIEGWRIQPISGLWGLAALTALKVGSGCMHAGPFCVLKVAA